MPEIDSYSLQGHEVNAEQKRLLLWSPFGSGEHYSGPATYSYRVFSQLDPQQFHCSLAHGFGEQGSYEVFRSQHQVGTSSPGIVSGLRYSASAKKWIRRNYQRFDLLHALSSFHHSIVGIEAAIRLGLPTSLFVSIKGGGLVSKGGLNGRLGVYGRRQKVARNISGIVALSAEIEQELLALGIQEKRIVRIPNFADTKKYQPADPAVKRALREELGVEDIPTVAFVGRLSERKRPKLLVQAIKTLRDKGTSVQLVFIGPKSDDDPYIAGIIRYIADHKLEREVIFTGFATTVEKWLQASDVFSLPSKNEGMPASVVEAMACGLPSVVTPFSSARELVGESWQGVILSEEPCVEETADAIETCLSSLIQQDLIARRRQRALDKYSLAAVAKMHSDMFSKIVSGQDPRP